MTEAKRSNTGRFGETTEPGTARARADGLPNRAVRASPAPLRPSSVVPLVTVRPVQERERVSVALYNLRGLATAFVLMTHASIAYIASAPAHALSFDRPPYGWQTYPIIDAHRWLGLDVFCALQDVFLMSMWFFLSGVFTWRSIEREGELAFVGKRVLRLGAPLLFGVAVLMPVALYPVYLVTASTPSLAGYAREYLALPFVPCGPLWFLWLLLPFTLVAAALRGFAPWAVLRIGDLSRQFESRPGRTFVAWTVICAAAYVPLALLFTPWSWSSHGPIAFQLCRPLLYAAYYCAGLCVGTVGLGKGMLRTDGVLARKWLIWMAAAAGSLALWMGLTALSLRLGPAAPLLLKFTNDASFALADACGVVCVLAVCLRFGTTVRWPVLAKLSDHALGLYVLHYAPVVWLQYALLGAPWAAPIKAALVISGTVASCMAVIVAAHSLRRSVGRRLPLRQAWGP